jgi:putative MFS transporter
MGVGLGAEIVVGYATFAEFVPPATRGRWLALLSVLTNCSLAVASFLGLWLIPVVGWRPMFAIAGVGALIVWFLRKSMPESPRWLESQGRFAEADALLRRIEAETGATDIAPAPAMGVPAPAAHGSVMDLFSPALLRRTLIGIVINVTVGFVVYGFVVWLPTLLLKQGHGISASLGFTAVMSIGAPVGALCGMVLADRVGRRLGLGGFSLLAALFGAAYPFADSAVLLMACGFAIVTCIYAIIALGFAVYVPELFPTAYRLRGAGLCGTSGRIASAGVQFVVVALFANAGLAGVVGLLVAILLVQAIVMFVFGVETARRPLEALSPADVTAGPG